MAKQENLEAKVLVSQYYIDFLELDSKTNETLVGGEEISDEDEKILAELAPEVYRNTFFDKEGLIQRPLFMSYMTDIYPGTKEKQMMIGICPLYEGDKIKRVDFGIGHLCDHITHGSIGSNSLWFKYKDRQAFMNRVKDWRAGEYLKWLRIDLSDPDWPKKHFEMNEDVE